MSDYAANRIRQIGAEREMERVQTKRPPAVRERINMGHPVHRLANRYIIKKRLKPETPMQANWFDVHDAFVAGWNAAKGCK